MGKIEKIRKEIERLYEGEAPKHDQQCDFDDGYFTGIGAISKFLDTVSEEPVSDELEEEIATWIPAHIEGNHEWRAIITEWAEIVARHFAEWGAEHLRKPTKMMDDDLEKAALEYAEKLTSESYLQIVHQTDFIAGAQWQKEQDSKMLEASWGEGFRRGKAVQKEQMMKEAVEGVIEGDWRDEDDEPYEICATSNSLDKSQFHICDKVKLIIIKENG